MIEGYLMRTNYSGGWLSGGPWKYQIYIPNEKAILGYFKNKKLDFSKEEGISVMVYQIVDSEKMDKRVKKNKFVGKFEIKEELLEVLNSSKEDFQKAQHNHRQDIENIVNSIKYRH